MRHQMLTLAALMIGVQAVHVAKAQSLEAEAGTIGGGAAVQSMSNASGGKDIGDLNNVGAFVEVTANGGTTGGTATLVIRYSNGYPDNRSLSLYVNGVKQRQIVFAKTGGWNTFLNTVSVSVSLSAGGNRVRLQRDASDMYAADIDRLTVTMVTVAPAPAPVPTPPPPAPAPAPCSCPPAPAPAPAPAGSATLSWTVPSTPGTGYRVYWGTASGVYSQTADVPGGGTTTYTVTGLSSGRAWYFAVKTVDTRVSPSESGYSNEVSKVVN